MVASLGSEKYFPAVCPHGHRPFLAPLVGVSGEALSPRCPACGLLALIIPGAYYGATRRDHFERLVDALESAELGEADAAAAVAELELLARQPEAVVRDGLLALPGFRAVAPLVPLDWEELMRFVSLLSGLISAAAQPRVSPEEQPAPVTSVRVVATSAAAGQPRDRYRKSGDSES